VHFCFFGGGRVVFDPDVVHFCFFAGESALFARDKVRFCFVAVGIADLCTESELEEVVFLDTDFALAQYCDELLSIDLEGTFKADIALVGDTATATPPLTQKESPPFQHFGHRDTPPPLKNCDPWTPTNGLHNFSLYNGNPCWLANHKQHMPHGLS
jgi:hypothetical protein